VIADRWLGRKRAVIIGGLIMAAGHFMMTFEPLFYGALAAIAIGNGLFLPSLPSQVGDLYAPGDPRRGSAYNVYYMGVNLGAVLAIFACGWVGETYGWHYGFALAGIGMITGLVVYLAGGRYLPPEPGPRVVEPGEPRAAIGLTGTVLILLGVALAVVIFRSAYEQVGNTIALWADKGIDRRLWGFSIPMTWFQMLNPALVMLLTPLLVARWTRLARQGRETGPLLKMAFGAAVVAAGYLILAGAAAAAEGQGAQASWLWLAAFFFVYTAGELYILPTGLSLFARMSPAHAGATTIAAWFLASFAGNLLAGQLGRLWSVTVPSWFFVLMAGVASVAALALFSLSRFRLPEPRR
jgi:POT family proton-dependent oligopeptide transporter